MNSSKFPIEIVIILSFMVMTGLLVFLHNDFYLAAETDGIGYLKRSSDPFHALSLMHGSGYSVFIWMIKKIGISEFCAGSIVSWISGIVYLGLSLLFLKHVFPNGSYVWGLIVLAITRPVIIGSYIVGSDMIAAVFFLAGLYLFILAGKKRYHYLLSAGVCIGIAWWVRPVYLPWIILFLAVQTSLGIKRKDRQMVIDSLVFVAGFSLLAVLWCFCYRAQTTVWPFSYNHIHFAAAALKRVPGNTAQWPPLDSWTNPWSVDGKLWPYLLINAVTVSKQYCIWFIRWSAFVIVPSVIMIYPKLKHRSIAISAFLSYFLIMSVSFYQERYLLPILPVCTGFLGGFLAMKQSKLAQSKIFKSVVQRWSHFLIIVKVLLVVVLSIHLYNGFQKLQNDSAPEYRHAVQYLQINAQPGQTVMAAKPHIPYLSDLNHIDLSGVTGSRDPVEALKHLIDTRNLSWVILDQRYAVKKVPGFHRFFIENPLKDVLIPVFEIEVPMKIIVYEVRQKGSR